MRKKIIACVITALCLFVSASPWEGAAATAPEGELPGNGRFIATNSFPRNTVVDIVNIETNKSTRVIVAGNLDSPGLLAIVSREAAELIGMRPGSVSRIRMTQPSDPVAYVRFTEGLSSGIPDYDSGDVMTEETYKDGFVNPAAPPNRAASAAESAAPPASPLFASEPDTGYPAYALEPEWGGGKSRRDIVDLPPAYTARDVNPETPLPVIINEPEEIAEAGPLEKTEEVPEKTAGIFPEDDFEEVAEIPEDEYYNDDFVKEPDAIATADEELEEITEDDYFDTPDEIVEYNIVPTDNRPPSSIYGIDPAFIIPGITNAPKTETPNKANNLINDPDFSVPRIKELTRGSYYVQLASFDTAESVQSSVSRIDQHYKPVVYKDGDKWYRVLLGPLNQGESAAVLARFKSIGYKDAFVRVAK